MTLEYQATEVQSDASAIISNYKYVGSPYCRAEMYAGRVAWWMFEFAPHALLTLEKAGTNGQTDRRTDATRGQLINIFAG